MRTLKLSDAGRTGPFTLSNRLDLLKSILKSNGNGIENGWKHRGSVIYILCSTLKYLFGVLNPQEMSVSFSAYARKQGIKLVDT